MVISQLQLPWALCFLALYCCFCYFLTSWILTAFDCWRQVINLTNLITPFCKVTKSNPGEIELSSYQNKTSHNRRLMFYCWITTQKIRFFFHFFNLVNTFNFFAQSCKVDTMRKLEDDKLAGISLSFQSQENFVLSSKLN